MYTASILFSVLTVLAHCTPALARRTDSTDITHVPTQLGLDDLHLLNHRDLLGDGILGSYSKSYRPDGTPYGYGWFHSGPAVEGDRCFANDREGTVANALCIVADINIGGQNTGPFNGWFQEPYYGYGNRFGWYHPGPYLNGDRCYQDGRQGVVQDTICVDLDASTGRGSDGGLLNGLNLGRRNVWGPDYWREPRFDPAYNFGWFSDGPFAQGDRCWTNGYYGSIVDSLCVLAKVDANLKRNTLSGLGGLGGILNSGGRSSYDNGDRCFKNGYWGRWRYDDCNILIDATATIGDGSYSSTPYRNSDRCWRAGSYGRWTDGDCSLLDLDLDLVQRQSEEYEDDSVSEYQGDEQYDEEEQPDVDEAESGSQEEQYDAWMERRLLRSKPGNNKGHALGKTVDNLVDGIKTRDLLSGLNGLDLSRETNGNGRNSQLGAADILATVGGGRNPGLLGGSRNGGSLLGRRSHRFGQSNDDDALNELVNSIGLAKRALKNYEPLSRRQNPHGRASNLLDGVPLVPGRLFGSR